MLFLIVMTKISLPFKSLEMLKECINITSGIFYLGKNPKFIGMTIALILIT